MNQLTDIKIIECNRQASNEIREDDLESNSSWRNNLTDVVELNAGDKVSVYSSFISVDGAGQTNTMDIKGKSLGVKKTLTSTQITSTKITDEADPNYNIAQTLQEDASNVETSFEVRDNEINMVVSYYKNMDLDGYVQLPRRFVKNYETTDTNVGETFNGWAIPRHDNKTEGRCLSNPWACYMDSDYKYFLSADGTPTDNCLKLRNDGSRFTLMIRNVAHFQKESGSNNLPFPTSYQHGGSPYTLDPENALYFQYKEIKTLNIPKGFNSATYISTELTRQLQEIQNDTTFTYKEIGSHETIYKTYSDYTTTKLLESKTYKGFNCGTILNYEKDQFDAVFTDNTGGELIAHRQVAYYQNYQYVLMKRPDLYEIGQRLNTIMGSGLQSLIQLTNPSNHILKTTYTYNAENLKKFKDFFEVQEKYPEIWAENNLRTAETQGDFYVNNPVNINNSRYLHMNRTENAFYRTENMGFEQNNLGFSYYVQSQDGYDEDKDELSSQVFFTYYDPAQKDKYYDNPDVEINQLTYGFASRNTTTNTINLHPNLLKKTDGTIIGLPSILFIGSGVIEADRRMGFDYHWNAYGNATIMLWDGRSKLMASSDINRAFQFRQTTTNRPEKDAPVVEPVVDNPLNTQFNTKSYLGSDATTIGYDGTHFFFSNFHTPKNVGTTSGAGSSLKHTTSDATPIYKNLEDFVVDAEKVVYKMNMLDDFLQFSPVRIPYQQKEQLPVNTGNNSKYLYQRPNINQDYYAIFDSICGLTIEDFGVDEDQWSNSLWGLMGFSYSQLHSNNNVRTQRIGTNNMNDLNILTTNAEVPIGDSKVFNQNPFGQSTYNNQLTQPISYVGAFDSNNLYLQYPTIQQSTQSLKIIAEDFPVSMARGYYSIRSDIISDTHFLGGRGNNTIMPIVAVVDKMNPQGDYYFGTESSIQFTMTGNRLLSSINVSIHDPDGSKANVGEFSSVLFKIEKQRKLSYNIAQELLLEEESKEKKK